MRTFTQKQDQTYYRPLFNNKRSISAASKARQDINPVLHLQRTIGNQAMQRLLRASTDVTTSFAHDFSRIPVDQQASAALKQVSRSSKSSIDILSNEGDVPDGPYIDQAAPAPPVAGPAPSPAAPVATARPTNLLQLLTGWVPGPNRYGFQLKFRCRSTSGNVQDLQNQAPNLIWREHVTYTRNDFAHRINPPNPTILPPPPGGVPFAPAYTRRVGPNLLEFNTVTDTHWMPTSAVRASDFQPAGPPLPPGFIGPLQLPLPAVMESRQVYQYSPNGGATWRYLAGAFIIRRTLYRSDGNLKFRTQKTGVHTTPENYKP